jgi:hypothetical protein
VAMLVYMTYRCEHYTSGYSFGRLRAAPQRHERVSA